MVLTPALHVVQLFRVHVSVRAVFQARLSLLCCCLNLTHSKIHETAAHLPQKGTDQLWESLDFVSLPCLRYLDQVILQRTLSCQGTKRQNGLREFVETAWFLPLELFQNAVLFPSNWEVEITFPSVFGIPV